MPVTGTGAARALEAPLDVLGIGLVLPPAVTVRDIVKRRGGDVRHYQSWDNACHASADDHPSTMGERALRRALERAGVAAAGLDLVIYCGASRDYPASWSVATEIMRLCGVPDDAVGLDLMAGCLATLSAIDLARGWLWSRGGGHAAVIAAERWTQTVDFADASGMALWGYGDGAGALVLGLETGTAGPVQFVGAEYRNESANNGHIFLPYGGTREPQPPPGAAPDVRRVSSRPRAEVTESYRRGFANAYKALTGRFREQPTHLICNQTTPKIVGMIGREFGLQDSTTVTGHATGHLGGPDLIAGLDAYLAGQHLDRWVAVAASSAYAFGAGLLRVTGHGGQAGNDLSRAMEQRGISRERDAT
jgi:3-oxoacyl-[acyl-carrier-protein] synthase-3